VLLKLNVVVCTPSPAAALLEPAWVEQTPSNARELDAQSSLVGRKIQENQVVSLIKSLGTLTKGAKKIEHKAALLEERVSALEKALKAATERKGRKKTRIQKHGSLLVLEGRKIAAQKAATQQLEDERRQDAAQSGVRRQATARCSSCRKPGHNSRTCKKDTVDTAEH
jgi:predicted transcriptional regulator